MKSRDDGLYIVLLSIHGLIRGENMELGRDPDTGGQIKYVVELARALSDHPRVERVELITRRIVDKRVSADYAEPCEQIADKSFIIRLPAGTSRYLKKESLWPYLDIFEDNAMTHFRELRRLPDIIHGHYADAGASGAHISQVLGVPFIFTGHSLGRVKRERLMEHGLSEERIEKVYSISSRIEAEEKALSAASRVVVSTRQEIEQQYSGYEYYQPDRMRVIPPGLDLERFFPVCEESPPPVSARIESVLADPNLPPILAVARPDERKNFATLIEAYAETPGLREQANLVLVMGNREDLREMEKGSRRVLQNVLYLIDRYDLYGSVAYPKQHAADEVPALYRWAAKRRGVFVNPALTEPFGLTLLEAAASGLPVVATEDGGPIDIVDTCRNGLLVDPLDSAAMGAAIKRAVADPRRWREWSECGIKAAQEHYSWESHVENYLELVDEAVAADNDSFNILRSSHGRLPYIDRMLVVDMDNTLLGDDEGLARLRQSIEETHDYIGLAIETGRGPDQVVAAIERYELPWPDIMITSVGTEIYYGRRRIIDRSWERHINFNWRPEQITDLLEKRVGLARQPESEQRPYKISYLLDGEDAPAPKELNRMIRKAGIKARLICSLGRYVDVVPIRVSPGMALRYWALKWKIPFERILAVGDSGNDYGMLKGQTLGVVVGNYSPELELLRGKERVYFAERSHAWGVLEGIEHYDFFGAIRIPGEGE
jgi:sucrose-phosphate synthase